MKANELTEAQAEKQKEIQALIQLYDLCPLPVEGTLFAETYRTQESINGKPCGTAMIGLYCDQPLSHSLFHRLSLDEVWHFYAGDPLRLILIEPNGSSQDIIMGPDPLQGHHVQYVIPAGVWQAGHLLQGGNYALFGCTLSPGFTPDIFEGGTQEILLKLCPERSPDIQRFACSPEHTVMPELDKNALV